MHAWSFFSLARGGWWQFSPAINRLATLPPPPHPIAHQNIQPTHRALPRRPTPRMTCRSTFPPSPSPSPLPLFPIPPPHSPVPPFPGFTLEDTLKRRPDVSKLYACRTALPMLKFCIKTVSVDLLLVVVPHDTIAHVMSIEASDTAQWRKIRASVVVPETAYVGVAVCACVCEHTHMWAGFCPPPPSPLTTCTVPAFWHALCQ